MSAMTSALVLLALASGAAAVISRLGTNYRRATAWPTTDDGSDRDTARLAADVTAARSATDQEPVRPRALPGSATGRRAVPPSVRAA